MSCTASHSLPLHHTQHPQRQPASTCMGAQWPHAMQERLLMHHMDLPKDCTSQLQVHTWSSRIPRVAEPNLVASSPRSLMSCSTKAELDSASAAPITTASSTLSTAASLGDAWKTCVMRATRCKTQKQLCLDAHCQREVAHLCHGFMLLLMEDSGQRVTSALPQCAFSIEGLVQLEMIGKNPLGYVQGFTFTRICVPKPWPGGNDIPVKTRVHSTIVTVPRPKAYLASACTARRILQLLPATPQGRLARMLASSHSRTRRDHINAWGPIQMRISMCIGMAPWAGKGHLQAVQG